MKKIKCLQCGKFINLDDIKLINKSFNGAFICPNCKSLVEEYELDEDIINELYFGS